MPKGGFNVLDFGATGDGQDANSGANRTAIQAAIDAAVAVGGGSVFIPRGTYCINGTLTITGNQKPIKFGGDSYATELRITARDHDMIHVGGDSFEEVDGVSKTVVEYIQMNSSIPMASGTYAIRVRNGHGISLQNLLINGYGGLQNGVLLQGGKAMYNYRLLNCEINAMGENGIVINKGTDDSSVTLPQGIYIDQCEIAGGVTKVGGTGFAQRGIWAKNVSGLYIANTEILGGNAGLVLEPDQGEVVLYLIINNLVSDSCMGDQLYAAPGVGTDGRLSDIQVSNSWFASSLTRHGISARGVHALQLNGCKIVNNRRNGMELFGDNQNTVINGCVMTTNNREDVPQYHGVYVGQTNRNTIITSNIIGSSCGYGSPNPASGDPGNKQRFGIFLDTTDEFVVAHNIVTGNVEGGIANNQEVGPSRVISGNIG